MDSMIRSDTNTLFEPVPLFNRKSSVAAALILSGLLLVLHMAIWRITIDDGYIFFRYAKNFAQGNGLVFNIGERVEGYSSFVWVMILGLTGKSGADILTAAKIFSLAAALGTMVVMLLIGRRLFGTAGQVGALAIFLLAGRVDYGMHFQSGMETALHGFLLSLGLLAYLNSLNRKLWATGIIGGALILTHPAGVFFAAAVIGYEIYRCIRSKQSGGYERILSFLVPVLLIVGIHALWRSSYYGDWLPNTFYAKQVPIEPYFLARGVYHLLKFFAFGGGIFYFAPAVVFAISFIGKTEIQALIVVISAYIIFNILSSGDWMVYSRFMVPVVPLIMILNAAGIIWIVSRVGRNRVILSVAIALMLLSGVQSGLLYTLSPTSEMIKTEKIEKIKWVSLSRYFNEMRKLHPDLKIAASAIGALGYYSNAYIIDMCGLVDKHIARNGVRYRGGSGHERSDMRYVMNKNPDIFAISAVIDSTDCRIKPIMFFFAFTPMTSVPYTADEIYDHIAGNYNYVHLKGHGHEFWIRKDLKYVEEMDARFDLPDYWKISSE